MDRTKEVRIKTDDIGKEMYMPTDKVNVPIMVNLMLIFSFLFVGAICFSSWEDWPLGTVHQIGFKSKVITRANHKRPS